MPPSPDHPSRPAIAYTRVSTPRQGEHGQGLEFQTKTIDEFARRAGYTIMTSFSDVRTAMGEGSIRDRPGAVAAVKLSLAKGWPVLVDGLDRFARDVSAVEKFMDQGRLRIISTRLGESDSYAAIASSFERAQRRGEQIRRTTREGMRKLKERGAVFGNRVNLDEAQRKGTASNMARAEERFLALTPVVRELRAQGCVSARAIAEGLNAKGLRTAQGRDWTHSNVRDLLRRVTCLEKPREDEDQDDHGSLIWGSW